MEISQKGRRPFKFENIWLSSDGFVDKVKGWWESYHFEGTPSFILARKLKALKLDLKQWNVEVFGDVLNRRRQAMADLNELDVEAESRPLSTEKAARKFRLVEELEKSFLQEEISWRQKSRAISLQEGDKNTKFFHRIANSNRRSSSISSLMINGELSSDKEAISSSITQFYQDLYSEGVSRRPFLDGLEFSMISNEGLRLVGKTF